jgi:hypothetical protein
MIPLFPQQGNLISEMGGFLKTKYNSYTTEDVVFLRVRSLHLSPNNQ